MLRLFQPVGMDKVKTVTPDRGKEFAKHEEITREFSHVHFYFPDPHAPWQRGTNENTNGLLRKYFPKHKEMDSVTDEQVKEYAYLLNTRPRKCLGWQTPFEVFFDTLLHLV